ncbi:hypothetical protein Gotri_006790 [Gossypium trilobum]|uniref:Uncharacterized protein n=1 Tax=Gossypium trilobum TaxID=34281 RepID=A0A7J9FPR1_9ROSI|nr:hypothetical protein [Gossypium trilobum]
MKRFAANLMTDPEYDWWWGKRINDNVPSSCQENTGPIEEHFQVFPSELEIVKQDFEKKSSELGKRIKKLEEEKIQDQLAKVQQDKKDQIQEFQRRLISQLTQLLARGIENGKSTLINFGDDNDDPTYPLGFTQVNV